MLDYAQGASSAPQFIGATATAELDHARHCHPARRSLPQRAPDCLAAASYAVLPQWPEHPASGIADAWFTLFAESSFRLGHSFTHADYLAFLRERHGEKSYLRLCYPVHCPAHLFRGRLPELFGASRCTPGCRSVMPIYAPIHSKPAHHPSVAPLETAFFPAYTAYFHLAGMNYLPLKPNWHWMNSPKAAAFSPYYTGTRAAQRSG